MLVPHQAHSSGLLEPASAGAAPGEASWTTYVGRAPGRGAGAAGGAT